MAIACYHDAVKPLEPEEELGKIACPTCNGHKTIPIVYGFPSQELFEEAEQGKIHLGGCVIGADMPTYSCSTCNTKF